jgi:CarboxypepD_reg-like domain/TonB-dependent Receptor Plug Domain
MRILATFCLTVVTLSLSGQTPISGRVTDVRGQLIPGANVFLRDTYDGATTDSVGYFEFTASGSGEGILVIKFIGFREFSSRVALEGNPIAIQVQLEEEINELDAVTITAGTFTASDESRRTIFRAADIATTAGATADIAGALNTLPGTQKVGESGRLFVRGGDGEETRTFIDGMFVLDPYRASAQNMPSRGRFLPFMFKGTSFSTGGYSSEYGQALSSTLVLDSKDKAETTRTDIGLMSVGADISHTQAWDNASIAGKFQYTNIRPYVTLISQEIDWIKAPASIEGSAVFRHKTGENGMLKAFGNFNHANFSLYNHDINDHAIRHAYELTNDYRYLNVAYKNVLTDNWSLRGGVSYSQNADDRATENNSTYDKEMGIHVKALLEGSLSEHMELKTGLEVLQRNYDEVVEPLEGQQTSNGFDELIAAGFTEADIYLSNSFVTRIGVRSEYNARLGKANLDPRISLAYKVNQTGSFSLAYGKFRQSPRSEWLRIRPALEEEKADHYIASYQRVEKNRTFRAELYYKRYYNLVKFDDNPESSLYNGGTGYARGFEFFWRDHSTFPNTDYWISYSYLDTRRDYLNFPYPVTPSFASAHNISVVYKYFISSLKSQVGMTYSFASGRPYDNPNKGAFNGEKTPNYQDLSINIAWLPRPNLILYLSATNLLGRDNIFGYEYSEEPDDYGFYKSRAVRQPARRFLFLGVFLTFSKSKSVNQLPSL